jgi:hypothetical protein
MITFPISATDEEIRAAVVTWSELLAQEQYAKALDMFLHSSDSFRFEWTPVHLEDWISNYGCPRADYDGEEFKKVTSLFEQPDADNYIRNAIDVDRENLYGLDPENYVGMVHYNDVPLNGRPSDLTARFHIKRIGLDQITLEFLDIHVM